MTASSHPLSTSSTAAGGRHVPPAAQGLYDPRFEHDACGIGMVVQIKGKKSADIVRDALTILLNLDHRGARGSDPHTGDGAGILIQLPDRLLRDVCVQEAGFVLPPAGDYGVGMVFMPRDADLHRACRDHFSSVIREEGQKLIGWRTVPVRPHELGETAAEVMPLIEMVFIQRQHVTGFDFERKLYKIRRRVTNAVRNVERLHSEQFYIASLSARTIVYKGMFTPQQLGSFFPDLSHPAIESAIALVHSRFSTNTFPNWARAHPYRFAIHNGEINTLRGNVNWMRAREKMMNAPWFQNLARIFPIVDEEGSDSSMFDNVLEFLVMNGLSLAHAMIMLIPEPWQRHKSMDAARRAFYEYHACLMEPWDGPAAMGFTDGIQAGAVLDRNGLRPARYLITRDDRLILASETGVLPVRPEDVVRKGRLEPGRMLLVDTAAGRIIADEEIKQTLATAFPYQEWLDTHLLTLDQIPLPENSPVPPHWLTEEALLALQKAFGYTFEDVRLLMAPMAAKGMEAIGSMGDDTPLAVLSDRPRLLYDYFKQLFAQVTNPPIDAIREELVTATETYLGTDGNLLLPLPENARRIKLSHPLLTNEELVRLKLIDQNGFRAATLPILYDPLGGGAALEDALTYLCRVADEAILAGANLLILSDRGVSRRYAPIPALLATGALHHHLIRQGTRVKVSLLVESAEPREVHQFACLLGYGAEAINPYLAFSAIKGLLDQGIVREVTPQQAEQKYVQAIVKGIIKICSKMGISTIQSYGGAQIFEALGLHQSVVERYFTGTPTRIQGSDLDVLAEETLRRHQAAFPERSLNGQTLPAGGKYQVRSDGEAHAYDPVTVHALQDACRKGDYAAWKRYAQGVNHQDRRQMTIRSLFGLKPLGQPVPLEEVEPVEAICRRFKTGAISYGAISLEAHTALAMAMNRIGGKSNTGEGGESRWRLLSSSADQLEQNELLNDHLITLLRQGDSARSSIKQVASGRFGVTSQYLVNADEIQIKMAQGAKPGEGGQLPGSKVYPWIAKVRYSTPGVGLISPPPHHDIYSIEDLAQLIFDLKNASPNARINVKLVSEVGVGTIAAGVAKGKADVILISGDGGGTGASPQTSIKHAGLPWELGLAETHQTLVLNDLRSRVRLETDGQLKTGRDVLVAALLGAEEFGFSTAPLVALGCIMMRVCHLNTCPVGVATQDPQLRQRFTGKPEHVVNFMQLLAQELRELLAQLGVRSLDEIIGRTDLLESTAVIDHWKAHGIDLSPILYQPGVPEEFGTHFTTPQQHHLERTLDYHTLREICRPALEDGQPVNARLPLRNVNRSVGTLTGSELTRRHPDGLPDDTIRIHFDGTAGQSFGAFLPRGMSFTLAGDANDYFGKGLSGGKLAIWPPRGSRFAPEDNIIIGNVALYGATAGEAYISGHAGERFAVRNSGATAVVEGVGDHGCEYMTGGEVVILGRTGRNFAAGMSGGYAYLIDWHGDLAQRVNTELVEMEPLDGEAARRVRTLIERHAALTGSPLARTVLDAWYELLPRFVTIVPRDYRRALNALVAAQAQGLGHDEAALAAFESVSGGKQGA